MKMVWNTLSLWCPFLPFFVLWSILTPLLFLTLLIFIHKSMHAGNPATLTNTNRIFLGRARRSDAVARVIAVRYIYSFDWHSSCQPLNFFFSQLLHECRLGLLFKACYPSLTPWWRDDLHLFNLALLNNDFDVLFRQGIILHVQHCTL